MICVKYRGELRRLTGVEAENVDCATLRELLRLLKKTYGREAVKAMQQCHVVVNGKRAASDLKLYDQDEVSFIPVCCGG